MAKNKWIGLSGGDWSNSSDWSAGAVPGPFDEAIIAAAGGYKVTVTTSETIKSVSLNDSGTLLDIQSGGTLAVRGSLAVHSGGTVEVEASGTLAIGRYLYISSSGTLFLDGGDIKGGSLVIAQGGALEVSEVFPEYTNPVANQNISTLQNVTVLGGLTLNGGTLALAGTTTIENSNGTGPGAITLNGSASTPQVSFGGGGITNLIFAEDYTIHALTLNGGWVEGAGAGSPHPTVTVGKGGLVQGDGGFVYGDYGYLALDNEGTINSNVKGQWLNIVEMPFVNDGLVEATRGGNISIDWNDSFAINDPWSNKAGAIISVGNGGTLELGGDVTNNGLIAALHGTIYFGGDTPFGLGQNAGDISVFDSALFFGATNTGVIIGVNSTIQLSSSQFATHVEKNTGDIVTLGGYLFLGDAGQTGPTPYQWQDSGLITTFGTAIDVQGNGDISAGGILSMHGGSVVGTASLEDDGQIFFHGGHIALSSLTVTVGAELSGFGIVANSIESSGIIDAREGKLDLANGVTGDGQLQISKTATLELGGPTAEAVTFESKFGALHLDQAREFSGTVAGMVKGDSIDLADFAFSSHPIITNVTGTGAAGSTTDVTITDGSLTTTLYLLNQYTGEYAVASKAYSLTSDHRGSGGAGTLFTLASPQGHDTFTFASNLGENVNAGSAAHHELFDPPTSEFADLAALLVQAQQDGAGLTMHDPLDISHPSAALASHYAHHFLV